jgi:preprotein translocase subunit SecD
MEKGKLYGSLIEGTYMTLKNQNNLATGEAVKLEGFTMVRLIDKTEGKDMSGNVATLYTLEDVFVQNKENRIAATDKENNILNGAYFKFANTSTSDMGEPVVAINLDDKGKEIFCNISEANIGKPMAIFVGGELLTAPNIQSKICGGSAQIDGSFTSESAKELSDALNDGALPAQLILTQEEKISPTLGDNAFTGALWAMFAGFIAIAVLIFFMYDFKKMILTCLVLGSFLILLFGLIKLSDYALSLSGIAAIILAIGMAVDANILMYERFREEIKDGKSMA